MTRAACAVLVFALGCGQGDATTDDEPNNDTFNLDSRSDTAEVPLAEMRVINLAVGEAPAKLHVDTRENAVLSDVDPLEGSVWRLVNAGQRTFRVGPEGGDEDAEWARLDLTVEAEERYTLIIFGGGKDIRLAAYRDDARTIPEGQVRYSIMNVGVDLPPVDVLDVTKGKEPTTMVKALAYGVGPEAVEQDLKELSLGVDVDRDGTPDATFVVPELDDRIVMPIYLLLDLDDSSLIMAGQAPQGEVRTFDSDFIVAPATK